ncbi:MAG: serine/threonine-protein kinase [Verrucomicrobiota bacterium]
MSEDRYEIVKKIGQGGIGAVYKAHDTRLGRDVAVKRLLPLDDNDQNRSATSDLKKEAATLSTLSNPHIVTVFDADEDEDGVFVVMELITGKTLDKIVRHAALPLEDFIAVAKQSLDGLIAAHDHNLLHRDIKPKNIMISWHKNGKFQLKLLDFGLAKFSVTPSLQTLDQNENILGSVHYMAPEQFERQPLDPRVDLYSLGCVLYFALAQDYAFKGDSPPAIMNNHLNHVVTPLHEIRPDVPRAYCDWVMRLISRDREDRPKTALVALNEFEQLEKSAGSAPATPPSNQPAPVARILPATDFDTTGMRTTTGALNTGRLNTGRLKTGANTVRTATTGSVPHHATSARTTSPARAQSAKQAALITAGIVVLLGGAVALINAASSSDPKTAALSAPAKPKKSGNAKPKPKNSPTTKPPAPAIPTPPRPRNLVGHYVAGVDCYSDKGDTPAEKGDPIRRWGDSAPNKGTNYFYRTSQDAERSPILDNANGNGFNKNHPVVKFQAGNILALTSGGLATSDPLRDTFNNGHFSIVAVYRTYENRPNDKVFVMDSIRRQGIFRIDQTPEYRRGFWPDSPQNQKAATLKIDPSDFIILIYSCNPDAETHRIRIKTPDGELHGSGDRPLVISPYEFERLKIGSFPGRTFPENTKDLFSGQLAEILLYDSWLPTSDAEEVERYLFEKYFAK